MGKTKAEATKASRSTRKDSVKKKEKGGKTTKKVEHVKNKKTVAKKIEEKKEESKKPEQKKDKKKPDKKNEERKKEERKKEESKKEESKKEEKKDIKKKEDMNTVDTKKDGKKNKEDKKKDGKTDKNDDEPKGKKSQEKKNQKEKKRSCSMEPEDKSTQPKRRSVLKTPNSSAGPTPPEKRVHFKSNPTIAQATPPITPRCTPEPSPAGSAARSLESWRQEAAERGVSLEELMEDMSAQVLESSLESHTHQLVAEAPASDEEEDEEEQDEANDQEDSGSEGESSKDDSDSSSTCDDEEANGEKDEEEDDEKCTTTEDEGTEFGDDEEEEEEEDEDNERVEKDLTKLFDREADGGKKQERNQAKISSSVAEANQKTQEQFATANSKTHKAEYDKFCRQCLDRKRFPTKLASHVIKDKLDVFRQWLMCSEVWENVVVEFERRAERRSTSCKQRSGMKARDIYKKYPKEKAEALIKRLRDKGMWYYDEDFEGDEEEIYYYCNEGNIIKDENIVSDTTTVRGTEKGNKEVVEALTGADGLLAAGACAAPTTANEAGQKALVESIVEAPTTQAKPKKPKKKDEAEKLEPKSITEKAKDYMESCLKKSADARKYAIALGATDYSGALSTQLMTFSQKMEQVYKILQDLTSRKVEEEKEYEKHFNIIDDKIVWYEKAEAGYLH